MPINTPVEVQNEAVFYFLGAVFDFRLGFLCFSVGVLHFISFVFVFRF